MPKGKPYSEEFKQGALKLVSEQKLRPSQVARDLGIDGDTLGRWMGEQERTVTLHASACRSRSADTRPRGRSPPARSAGHAARGASSAPSRCAECGRSHRRSRSRRRAARRAGAMRPGYPHCAHRRARPPAPQAVRLAARSDRCGGRRAPGTVVYLPIVAVVVTLCTIVHNLKRAHLILDLPARDLTLAPETEHQLGRATL